MNKRQSWLIYIIPAIITIMVVVVTILWCFFSCYKPAEPQLRYEKAQLIFTIVGFLGIVYSLLFATHQFARSQRKPNLQAVFAESLKPFSLIEIPHGVRTLRNMNLTAVNKGNSIAIWFEIIVDLSNLPWGFSYVAPQWAQVGEQYESTNSGFILRSFGRAAVFTTTPLQIGIVQFHDAFAERPSKYEIPYQINGDWGPPKKGSLWPEVKPVEA